MTQQQPTKKTLKERVAKLERDLKALQLATGALGKGGNWEGATKHTKMFTADLLAKLEATPEDEERADKLAWTFKSTG